MCIVSLLLPDGREGQVLEPFHLRLQKPEVHGGRAAIVLPLGFFHAGAFDAEHRHPSAIHPPDLDGLKLPSPDQPEGSEEQVIGQKHRSPPFSLRSRRRSPNLRRFNQTPAPSAPSTPPAATKTVNAVDGRGELI
jgi:hypothetical protein